MPPKRQKTQKDGKNTLSQEVRKGLNEFGVRQAWDAHALGVASDHLLRKLKLPKKKLEKAREIESNTLRLGRAISAISRKEPISVKSAVKIFETALDQLSNLPAEKQNELEDFEYACKNNLRFLKTNRIEWLSFPRPLASYARL